MATNKELVDKMVEEGGNRPLFTYVVTHIGPPNKPAPRTEKIKAYTPQEALLPFKGRNMTKDELAALKNKK